MNHEDHDFGGMCPTCGQPYQGEKLETAVNLLAEAYRSSDVRLNADWIERYNAFSLKVRT